jgi:hypothetical protein
VVRKLDRKKYWNHVARKIERAFTDVETLMYGAYSDTLSTAA